MIIGLKNIEYDSFCKKDNCYLSKTKGTYEPHKDGIKVGVYKCYGCKTEYYSEKEYMDAVAKLKARKNAKVREENRQKVVEKLIGTYKPIYMRYDILEILDYITFPEESDAVKKYIVENKHCRIGNKDISTIFEDSSVSEDIKKLVRSALAKKFQYEQFKETDFALHKSHIHANIPYFFLYKYIPKRCFNKYSKDEVNISQKIWRYKDFYSDSLNYFSLGFMYALDKIADKLPDSIDKIGLIVIPSSKCDKPSPVARSAQILENTYNHDHRWCEKQIINMEDTLKRFINVQTSHLSSECRASYSDHIKSIACTLRKYDPHMLYVLLDDISTTGDHIYACHDILISKGVDPTHIIGLTIGHTVNEC